MVRITPPRKLWAAGLFGYTPVSTIEGVMSHAKEERGSGMQSGGISRRRMLKGVGLAAGGALLGSGLTLAATRRGIAQDAGVERPWYELDIIGEPVMDDQLLWYLSHTGQGMSDIGECLDTASRIEAGDENSWPKEWLRTAERVRQMGENSLAKGHERSAGEAYLRAANYYRAALIHHPEPKDPGVVHAGRQSVTCFDKALELLSIPAQPLRIPYEGTTLPGYFFPSPVARGEAPILILHQGRDAWPEEAMWAVDGATKRGYHCLIFHGPGQGMAIREQGLTFRPDWEKVVTPVVDFALELPGVEPEGVILMGLSMGGALAPRAAAFEERIKVCIANPGVLNWGEAMYAHFEGYGLMNLLEASPHAFNTAVDALTRTWPTADWWFRDAAWKHGATSPADLMAKLGDFDNEAIVDRISCQMLIMDGTAEEFTAGQAKKLYDALNSPKDYMLFTEEDTGLAHCQNGALRVASQRMFDWLDEHV
jgi:alpha-beta hydrolase superfamily lysophospholipase